MTWSPFLTDVTPGPMSTTTPAPSCPRIAGNSPSGSAPERVNSSVWQMPVALISTSTSPALGPSSCTWVTASGFPASNATAARTSILKSPSGVCVGPNFGHACRSGKSQNVNGNRSLTAFGHCCPQMSQMSLAFKSPSSSRTHWIDYLALAALSVGVLCLTARATLAPRDPQSGAAVVFRPVDCA